MMLRTRANHHYKGSLSYFLLFMYYFNLDSFRFEEELFITFRWIYFVQHVICLVLRVQFCLRKHQETHIYVADWVKLFIHSCYRLMKLLMVYNQQLCVKDLSIIMHLQWEGGVLLLGYYLCVEQLGDNASNTDKTGTPL